MPASAPRLSWQMNWMKFQGQLLARRGALGLTQAELAEKLGRDVSTIKRWEAGRNSASGESLFKWAAALGISITTEVVEEGISAPKAVSA